MMDDVDRQVCARVEKDLSLGDDWEIVGREFLDPAIVLHLVIHKGTSLEKKAHITIDYLHKG